MQLVPRVTYRDTSLGIMNTHANTLLCSPDFGLEKQTKISYQEQTLEQMRMLL